MEGTVDDVQYCKTIDCFSPWFFAGTALAESVTVTLAVQQDCQWDYHNFCSQYAIGSDLLDICFKKNGPKLSKACVDALIAAGDTSQEYVDQQKLLGR